MFAAQSSIGNKLIRRKSNLLNSAHLGGVFLPISAGTDSIFMHLLHKVIRSAIE